MLHELITAQHQQIVTRASRKTAARSIQQCTGLELDQGVSILLDQIVDVLRAPVSGTGLMNERAAKQWSNLRRTGFSVSQVVHSYGDVCQAVTELALEVDTPVATNDFRVFSRCLDEAIASALAAYEQERDTEITRSSAERLSLLVRELVRPVSSALFALDGLSALDGFKRGSLLLHTNAGALLDRSLLLLQSLIDKALAEVPQDQGDGAPVVG